MTQPKPMSAQEILAKYQSENLKDDVRSELIAYTAYLMEKMPSDSKKYLNEALREGHIIGIRDCRYILQSEIDKLSK